VLVTVQESSAIRILREHETRAKRYIVLSCSTTSGLVRLALTQDEQLKREG
jgi:hypothetical protein